MQLRPLHKALANQRGSSLLECLLSLTLFTFAMMMLATMMSTAGIITNRATDLENAVNRTVNLAEVNTSAGDQEVTLKFESEDGVTSVTVPAKLVRVSDPGDTTDPITLWRFEPLPAASGGS